MSPARRALAQRLGLGLAAFAALPFLNNLEDAYALPQRLALGLGALLLAASLPARWPAGPLAWTALAVFAWRAFCRAVDAPAGDDLAWAAQALPVAALYAFAAAALLEPERRRYLAAAVPGAGAAVAAFALLQWAGLSPFEAGAVDMGFAGRAHGSLGNPDFLGGWLAMVLPAGAVFAVSAEAGAAPGAAAARKLLVSAAVLMAVALVLTEARASWLAGAAGLGVALLHRRRPVQSGRVLAVAAVVLLGTLAALSALRGALPARLAEAVDLRSDAWRSRAMMSACALDLAREHPLTGVGPGGFADGFLRAQGPRLAAAPGQPWRYTLDAHNDWLQAAAEGGWPGFLLWVAAFALALRAAWRRRGPGGAALAGGLAALGVQGLFHFPLGIPASAGLAWLGLALAAAWDAEDAGSVRLHPAWPVAAALLLSASLGLELKALAASAALNAGNTAALQPALAAQAPLHWRAATRLAPDDARAWLRLGRDQLARGEADAAVASLQRALAAHPDLPEAWINLGLALAQAGSLDAAGRAFEQGAALNPRSGEAWSNLGKLAWMRGRHADAEALLRRGLDEGGESVQGYFNLAALLYNERRFHEAADAFRAVLRLQPDHAEAARLLKACEHAR